MLASILTLALAAGAAAAQQSPTLPVVPPATPYSLSWDHDGANGAFFRLWIDGVIVRNWKTDEVTRSGNTWTAAGVPFTAAQVGQHVIGVSAYNDTGDSGPITIPIRVAYLTAPAVPAGLRLTIMTVQVAEARPPGSR